MLTTLVLVIHALLALALVGVILLQRSEGGGLGIGGGNAGGLMSARGAADLLTRATTWLAAGFIATSILLAVLAASAHKSRVIDTSLAKPATTAPATGPGGIQIIPQAAPVPPADNGVPLAK